jgi:hypothetical protein
MKATPILSAVAAASLLAVAQQAGALPLAPSGNYEGVFFRNSEVFLDNDGDGLVSVGDQFWGVMNLNELTDAGADASGQTGPQIWPLGGAAAPPEVTGYFAIEVAFAVPPGTSAPPNHPISAGSADIATLVFTSTTDPNGILAAGDVMNIYEDGNIDYNDATQGTALGTATDGSLLGSLALPNPFDPGADSYWYALAPLVPLGQGDVAEAFAGLVEGTDEFPWDFGPVNDPNEDYSSNAQVAGGVDVDFWFNTEFFGLAGGAPTGFALGPDEAMHFGSNDPAVFMPVSVIPEPSTIILLGMGLVGMAAYGRKRLA